MSIILTVDLSYIKMLFRKTSTLSVAVTQQEKVENLVNKKQQLRLTQYARQV